MVKQFTLGLCGLLKKSKLSLVSVNFMVLQVASGSPEKWGVSCGITVCYGYEVLSYSILV
jgi:hypothetical protein